MTSGTPNSANTPPPSGADGARAPHDKLRETHSELDTSAQAKGGPARMPSAANAQSWIGRRLDRYELRGLLGTGGMGVVYLAHDLLIERDVAIKMLPEEVAVNETILRRFLAEAKAAGQLTHPNTVGVYEVNKTDNAYYLVMEYVGGGTIADELEKAGLLSVREATQITADACRGLMAAHNVGLVHRDIKPANLLRGSDGTVKIADFGLAKQTLKTTRQLTQDGAVAGTPYYMSPEQCESKPLDGRSDLYSLGATYYSLLTGAFPYEDAGSIVQVMFAHCEGELLDPRKSNPGVPPACSKIVARAMAKRPEDRYQSAGEMLGDLQTVLGTLTAPESITLPSDATQAARRRTSRRQLLTGGALAGVAALVGGGGIAWWLTRSDSAGEPSPTVVPPLFKDPPLRVGVLHSLSGAMQESESPVVDATLLAIEEVNQAGGVLGRRVEAIVRDGRSDPQVFASEARRLIVDDKVCTLFGCWTSASRKTLLPVLERHDQLLVYPVQYEGIEQSPHVIYLGATPNQQIVPALQWFFAFQNKRRFFLVGSDYVFPRTANAIIRDVVAKLGGEVVGEAYLPLGSFEVNATVQEIVAAKPDLILNTINGDSNVPFFRRLRAAGITPEQVPTLSFSIGEQEVRHLDPAQTAGDYASWNYFQSLESLENKHFVSSFLARFGAQRAVTDPMEVAYIGVKLWAKAVQQAGDDSPAKIRRAFDHQKILAPEGEVTIDTATQHAFKTPRVGQLQTDGQFDVVWTGVKPIAPEPFPATRTRAEWEAFVQQLYTGWGDRWAAPE